MQRFLRPKFLVPVNDRLWAVDELQPVAAVLDPVEARLERVVSYPELPAPPVTFAPWFDGWRVLGSSAGLWVQPSRDGPVTLINEGGLVHASYSAGTRLQQATTAGAWCAPQFVAQSVPDATTTSPQRPLRPTRLLLIRPDGTPLTLAVDRPVHELRADVDGVYASVYEGQKWIRLSSADTSVRVDEQANVTPPASPARLCNGTSGPGSPWHTPPFNGDGGPLAGGMRWEFGWDRQRRGEQLAVATGHDPNTNDEQQRVELGSGRVLAVAPIGICLWIAVRRSRWFSPSVRGSVELSSIDARDGSLTTLMPADTVDITEGCWPLPLEPVDADSYAEYQRNNFEGLAASGMTDCRTELVGAWPETEVRISFSHTRFPGLRLVRTVLIFDELGRQRLPYDASIRLVEDLDTGNLPSVNEAVNGVLYV